jgi:cytochrome c-type biogenesis protein CcmH/NrfF
MPVLLLWAVPAVIVIGGAGYWLVHMHRSAKFG